ncbi:MAG: hypothetical protein K2F57_07090, partial [Candidatus Gastranaerophilales bacterium]|nr:hypothetical protein [Candidatus Gastranaerophilales bacterium]
VLWNKLLVNFFSVPPSSSLELWLDMFFGLLIFIYLLGYRYRYVNSVFNGGDGSLLEFNLEPFVVILRTFPMIVLWHVYMILFSAVGTLILMSVEHTGLYYLFASVVVCLTPFLYLILIDFAKDFKYEKKYFSPKLIFRFLEKYLGSVIYLFFELLVIMLIPVAIIVGLILSTKFIQAETLKLGIQLWTLCLGVYFAVVIKYVLSKGLAEIIKTNPE